tara:strand:+ start:94 stop:198 length:105 start_codon:yes stop_codon:yes gene_type:complete
MSTTEVKDPTASAAALSTDKPPSNAGGSKPVSPR